MLNPDVPQRIVGRDGAEMVLIPAGEFQMGSNYHDSEQPVHTVYVDAFYMDVHEVTLGQYNQFVRATRHPPLPANISAYCPTDRHPVVFVSWNDAMAYAKWAGETTTDRGGVGICRTWWLGRSEISVGQRATQWYTVQFCR